MSDEFRAYDRELRLIERLGQAGLTITVALFIVLGLVWPEPYKNVFQLVLIHILAGRLGNVVLGLEYGFHPFFLFIQCFIQDILTMLLIYPPFVGGYRRAIEWRIVGPALVNLRATADRHKMKIEPFGAVGLCLFVLIPFWSTGALVGAVIGYLLGMRTWVTFSSVAIGNMLAVGLWVYLIGHGYRTLEEFVSKEAIVAFVAGMVVIALAVHFRNLHTKRKTTVSTQGERTDMFVDGAQETPPEDSGS